MTKSPSALRHPAPTGAAPARDGAPSHRVPWPPDPFHYLDGRLHVGDLPLEEVVADTGTPAYVYDLDAVAAAYRRVAAAFEPLGARVLYAVKANANLAVLGTLAELGSGFDVVSGGELVRVLRAGGDPEACVFAGVGKTTEELALAVGHGVTVHVESADELDALQAVAARLERPARFAVRVNPDVEVDTHVNIQTGHDEAKFGVPVAVAHELLGRAARGDLPLCHPVGVHVHVGSQLPDPEGVAAGARVGLEVLESGRAAGLELDWLDVGGGLPVDYAGGSALGPELFAAALAPLLAGRNVRLAVEPGRALVARAGALVASVLYRKHRSAGRMLVVDTGMHHLLRPALYQAVHRVRPLRAAPLAGPTEVVGPICESTDVLATEADLPDLAPGELVAFLDTGAYGMTMASNYNGQPRPAELVVEGGVARVARRRETWEELL
ncbi:MAG TPA: diaminopimelate decarboxylase, partial [Actinomycetes bacterium]|nr:diaminopimelate decarboxylase [Actinomycetes bacterium]